MSRTAELWAHGMRWRSAHTAPWSCIRSTPYNLMPTWRRNLPPWRSIDPCPYTSTCAGSRRPSWLLGRSRSQSGGSATASPARHAGSAVSGALVGSILACLTTLQGVVGSVRRKIRPSSVCAFVPWSPRRVHFSMCRCSAPPMMSSIATRIWQPVIFRQAWRRDGSRMTKFRG